MPQQYFLPPSPLQLPTALPVPVSLPCMGVLCLTCLVSPLGNPLTLSSAGELSWWCRATASPQLSVVQLSSPSIKFPRLLWGALLLTQTSSQDLFGESLCSIDHLGKTGRDAHPGKLCSGLVYFTCPCPGCPPCPFGRKSGCKGLALRELPLLQPKHSVTLSTSRLQREIVNALSLCFYEQETTNKPTTFNGQENYLNKIAIGYHRNPTCSC